jgi:orotidine-5'-phosphate decarboxylase
MRKLIGHNACMTAYADRLHDAIRRKRTPALVGLDPRWEDLPDGIKLSLPAGEAGDLGARAAGFEHFCRTVIDVVAPLVPAVKPQAAFFEQCGPVGVLALQRVIAHAREQGLVVICDAKRGDIGTTAEAYAHAYLAGEDPTAAPFAADALTVNPYLGADTLEPFVRLASERGGGVYVLVRTSNAGAGIFQDPGDDGRPIYVRVAEVVEQLANWSRGDAAYGAVGAVVGATYPQELAELRDQMPHAPLLVPGYGSQGGTAADVAAGFDEQGLGAVVNSSRGIIFAYRKAPYAERFGPDRWEDAVAAATRDMIADLKAATPCSALDG